MGLVYPKSVKPASNPIFYIDSPSARVTFVISMNGRICPRNKVQPTNYQRKTQEVVGGYWFIVARSLRDAAELAAQNPCAQFGLTFEIRPLEPERASAYKLANETPTLDPAER